MSTDHRVLPSSQSRWHFQVENGNRAGANDFAPEPSSPLPKTRSPAFLFLLLFLFDYLLADKTATGGGGVWADASMVGIKEVGKVNGARHDGNERERH
jgi:hypothetical protein